MSHKQYLWSCSPLYFSWHSRFTFQDIPVLILIVMKQWFGWNFYHDNQRKQERILQLYCYFPYNLKEQNIKIDLIPSLLLSSASSSKRKKSDIANDSFFTLIFVTAYNGSADLSSSSLIPLPLAGSAAVWTSGHHHEDSRSPKEEPGAPTGDRGPAEANQKICAVRSLQSREQTHSWEHPVWSTIIWGEQSETVWSEALNWIWWKLAVGVMKLYGISIVKFGDMKLLWSPGGNGWSSDEKGLQE